MLTLHRPDYGAGSWAKRTKVLVLHSQGNWTAYLKVPLFTVRRLNSVRPRISSVSRPCCPLPGTRLLVEMPGLAYPVLSDPHPSSSQRVPPPGPSPRAYISAELRRQNPSIPLRMNIEQSIRRLRLQRTHRHRLQKVQSGQVPAKLETLCEIKQRDTTRPG